MATWVQKVRFLAKGRVLAQIEQEANWPENALATSLNRGSTPRSDRGIQLARALKVPAEWLFDDSDDSLTPHAHANPPIHEIPEAMEKLVLEVVDAIVQRYS